MALGQVSSRALHQCLRPGRRRGGRARDAADHASQQPPQLHYGLPPLSVCMTQAPCNDPVDDLGISPTADHLEES